MKMRKTKKTAAQCIDDLNKACADLKRCLSRAAISDLKKLHAKFFKKEVDSESALPDKPCGHPAIVINDVRVVVKVRSWCDGCGNKCVGQNNCLLSSGGIDGDTT